jgi:hypothetical protein
MSWRWGSYGRVTAFHTWSPEFKLQFHQKKKTTKQNKLANSSYGYTGFQCAILSTDIFQNKKEVITWKHDKRSDRIWGDAYADYQVDYPMYTWMKTSHYIS